jgi:hypothetical protein
MITAAEGLPAANDFSIPVQSPAGDELLAEAGLGVDPLAELAHFGPIPPTAAGSAGSGGRALGCGGWRGIGVIIRAELGNGEKAMGSGRAVVGGGVGL